MRSLDWLLLALSFSTLQGCCPCGRRQTSPPTAHEVAADLARSPELAAELARQTARAMPAELPPVAASGEDITSTLAVTLTRSGVVYLDGRPAGEDEIRSVIQQARATSEVRAVIAADAEVPQSRVVQMIDLVRAAGVERLAVSIAAPDDDAGPGAFEELLGEVVLAGQPFDRFRDALRPHLGRRVRWRLRSWGGEIASDGFVTPRGHEPPSMSRVRLVSPAIGHADLAVVRAAGHPVVACLREGELARPVGAGAAISTVRSVVTIEATVWGATDEGGPVLWLRDCAVAPAR